MSSFLLTGEIEYAKENNIFIEDFSKRMFNYGMVIGVLSDGEYHSIREVASRTGLKMCEVFGLMSGRRDRVNDIEINRSDFKTTKLRLIK